MIPYEQEVTVTADLDGKGESQDCEVRAKVHSLGHPGTMYRNNGDPGDPPEGPEVEILSVAVHDEDGRRLFVLLNTIKDEDFEKLQFLVEDAILEQDCMPQDFSVDGDCWDDQNGP